MLSKKPTNRSSEAQSRVNKYLRDLVALKEVKTACKVERECTKPEKFWETV
jgi:hypothetical protein